MRIKKMAVVLFVFVFLSCLPFVFELLMGERVIPVLQNYYQPSNQMAYISYAVLVLLLIMLLSPIVYKRKDSMKDAVATGGFVIKKLAVKIEIEKNGIDSRIHIRRVK